MNAKVFFLAIMCLWPVSLTAQGFAGLGENAEGFALPNRDQPLVFPKDHGAHPVYRIEWWYLTATLAGDDGQDYGIQWTLFRTASSPEDKDGWSSPQMWMGHAGLTTPRQHFSAERLSRGGIGQADVVARPFSAFIDDWEMSSTAPADDDPLDALSLRARGDAFSYDLSLAATGPLVLHGDQGYSVKAETGQASFYYSQPFYRVSGKLSLPGGDVQVTGHGWLDREWSSQPLTGDQVGWDWFAIRFDSGARLMAAGTRKRDGDHFTAATWIEPDGTVTTYENGDLLLTPLGTHRVKGRDIPVHWRIVLPNRGLRIEARALNPDSWMDTSFAYWEGPITVSGSATGTGYLEMTGYDIAP